MIGCLDSFSEYTDFRHAALRTCHGSDGFLSITVGTSLHDAKRRDRRLLLWIMLAGLLLRGLVSWVAVSRLSSDPDGYRALAESMARTGVFGLTDPSTGRGVPTAFRPPLYPYLLSLITVGGQLHGWAVAGLHGLLGTITVVCTFLASRQLLGQSWRPQVGVIAALLVAIDPILLNQSTLLMTETMATALASIVLCSAVASCQRQPWRPAVVLAVALAGGYLCRPTFIVWAALFCLAAMISTRWTEPNRDQQQPWRARILPIIMIAAVVSTALGLWTWRNLRTFGQPIWATTHGGYTLLLGNNPDFYDYLSEHRFGSAWNPDSFLVAYLHRYNDDPRQAEFWHRDWTTQPAAVAEVTEYEDDQLAYQAARATIRRRPKMFLWSCLVRVGRLWSPLPHMAEQPHADRGGADPAAATPALRWARLAIVAIYYLLFYALVVLGLRKIGLARALRQLWPIWTLLLALSLVHLFYWSNLRMRAPAIPGLAIVAAAVVSRPNRLE